MILYELERVNVKNGFDYTLLVMKIIEKNVYATKRIEPLVGNQNSMVPCNIKITGKMES